MQQSLGIIHAMNCVGTSVELREQWQLLSTFITNIPKSECKVQVNTCHCWVKRTPTDAITDATE